MKISIRRAVRAAVVGLAATSLAVAGTAPSHAANKRMVFSPIAMAIPALQGLAGAVQGWGAGHGWDVQIVDGAFNPQTQHDGLKTLIENDAVDAIWVIAVNPAALSDLMPLAQTHHVAILANGTPEDYGLSSSNFPKGLSFGLINYKAVGVALGTQLANCINSKLGGKTDVMFSVSAPGSAGKADIEKNALTVLKQKAPKAKIVVKVVGTSRTKAQTDTRTALVRYKGVKALMSTQDEGTLGGLGAFTAARRPLTCAVGFGGNDEVLAKVHAKKLYAAIALDFMGDFGQTVAELGRLAGHTSTLKGKQLYVPMNVVTK